MCRRYYILFFLVLGLDQATKALVMHYADHLPLTVTSWLNIILLWNPGVLFGISLFSEPWAYLALTLSICGFVVYTIIKTQCTHERLTLTMILAAAIGNIVDRIRFSAVVDFIDMHYQHMHWPAFNVADAVISCGIFWLGIQFLRKPL